jgi:hypothetical protein
VSECSCADWLENLPKVNAPIMLQAARNPHHGGYTGMPFRFCPWCGKGLIDEAKLAAVTKVIEVVMDAMDDAPR